MKKRDLGFGHLGNGTTVYDRLHMKNGDYEIVAHVSVNGNVKFRVELNAEDRKCITDYADATYPVATHNSKG